MGNENVKTALHQIKNWVFDLDDTLYPPSEEIYSQMATRIRAYIMNTLDVDEETAGVIQKSYYKKYGATVHGLMVEHQIMPEDFTDYVHNLDLSSLKPNPTLRECLKALPGKRFVFTNGAYEHAERVLARVNLADLIDDIFSIREANYVPKPAAKTYERMIAQFGINPSESIMFDDNQANVLSAKASGMKAVWISSNIANNPYCTVEDPDFCDFQTPDIVSFLSPYFIKGKMVS